MNRYKYNPNQLLSLVLLFAMAAGLWKTAPAAAQQAAQNSLKIYLPVISAPPALPPSDEAASRISVPAGFSIRIFAQGIVSPRLLTRGPDGAIYAALMFAGQIVRLPDRDHDGLADGVEVAASGLTQPHNVEWFDGWMYVAETGLIERLADNNNDGVYETRELVTNNIPGVGNHNSRTLHFGPDGKLYVSAGSSCNICVESDPRRAAILRFNPDGTIPDDNPYYNNPDPMKHPVWAAGLRNSVDFLWLGEQSLWANMNGSDGLGDNLPAEAIMIPVEKAGWYGWPYCYNTVVGLNQPPQPLAHDTRMLLPGGLTCAQGTPALLSVEAHSAPLGMRQAGGSHFPAEYQDDIFVALHGSWNTSTSSYRDCKVQRIIIQNGQVVGSQTFANGWRAANKPCGDSATWGRPAGIAFGSDGALYISDDKSGRVYRVIYRGQ